MNTALLFRSILLVSCLAFLGCAAKTQKPDGDKSAASAQLETTPNSATNAPPQSSAAAPAIEPSAELAAILTPIRDANHLPALIGAIVNDDGLVEIGVVGVRKAGDDTPATVNDAWHLGSCTKAMTATLVAMLVEDGKLNWQTTIGDAFPELRDQMKPEFRDTPVEWLCQNRGGVPTALDADGLWGRLWRHAGTPVEARKELVKGVVTHDPAAPPGTRFIYSNGGFSIAGAMAERITGTSWEDLIEARIFKPLGMCSAGFGAPGVQDRVDQPYGHHLRNKKSIPITPGPKADNPVAISPAGRVHCTFPDWAKFISMHLRGDRAARGLISADALAHKPPLLLEPMTFTKLHAAAPGQAYAMGWVTAKRAWGGDVFWHNGSNTMWYVVTWISPEKNLAVLVGTNIAGDGVDQACDKAAWKLIERQLKRQKQSQSQ